MSFLLTNLNSLLKNVRLPYNPECVAHSAHRSSMAISTWLFTSEKSTELTSECDVKFVINCSTRRLDVPGLTPEFLDFLDQGYIPPNRIKRMKRQQRLLLEKQDKNQNEGSEQSFDISETDSRNEEVKMLSVSNNSRNSNEQLKRKKIACSRCDESFETQKETSIHNLTHLRIDGRINCSECSDYFVRPEDYFSHSCFCLDIKFESGSESPAVQSASPIFFEDSAPSPPESIQQHDPLEIIPDSEGQQSSKRSSEPPAPVIQSVRSMVDPKSNKFFCDLCNHPQFGSYYRFVRHLHTHPQYQHSLCQYCGHTFPTRSEKLAHSRAAHEKKRQTRLCQICGKTLLQTSIREHIKQYHSASSFMCEDCGQVFENGVKLKLHKLNHLPEKPVSCQFCSFRCNVLAQRIQHLRARHLGPHGFEEYQVENLPKPHKCTECDKEYTSQMALNQHRIFHGERKYKCKKCPWKCFTNYHLRAHGIAFHTPGANNVVQSVKWFCKFCVAHCPNRFELYLHEIKCWKRQEADRAPEGEADIRKTDDGWQCQLCNKTCRKKADALYHYRAAHSGTYTYVCEICGKGTNSQSNMIVHMKQHGGAYQCPSCGDRFQKSVDLLEHEGKEHGNSEKRGGKWVRPDRARSRGDNKLIEALFGLDGEEGYKVAVGGGRSEPWIWNRLGDIYFDNLL